MRNRNHAYLLLIGGVGVALLLSGCPKKVETAKSMATVQEEKVTPPAEAVKPEPVPTPRVEETPVAREAEAPAVVREAGALSVEKGMADAYFDFDKYNIREDARAALEADARWLNGNPKVRVKIEGHADERGTSEYNLALGERRAQAVKRFLSALGVDEGRLSTLSYGEERPVCTEQNEACYAKNRRVHFTIQ